MAEAHLLWQKLYNNFLMSIFNSIQLILLIILFAYILYYAYSVFFGKEYQPKIWKEKIRNGFISNELKKTESKYKDKDRFFNFWFQIDRLIEYKVKGDFAELGVYKGDSAEVLHKMDPTRTIHLFDTFEGFQQKDLNNESGKAATYTEHSFADTTIERVKQRLNKENFIFHQGSFPESVVGLNDEKYALVNMDVDLYNPTKAGLNYFYPKLSPGGVILVHDYNTDWPGIMKAVDDFALTINTPIVPLNDRDNTIMIFKPYS